MFYVFALIVIMSVTPWSSVVPSKSPFVELFVLVAAGGGEPDQLRGADLGGLFRQQRRVLTSRMLFGLAQDGQAPKMFAAVEACGTGERPDLLLYVSAGRRGHADGQSA
jgi:D-serine/D-alanine/glycine transporter